MNSWKYFLGASILAVGLLVKAGAPIVPLALGLAVAAFFTFFRWKKSRQINQPRR
jgi:uncharacterized membrane protein